MENEKIAKECINKTKESYNALMISSSKILKH